MAITGLNMICISLLTSDGSVFILTWGFVSMSQLVCITFCDAYLAPCFARSSSFHVLAKDYVPKNLIRKISRYYILTACQQSKMTGLSIALY